MSKENNLIINQKEKQLKDLDKIPNKKPKYIRTKNNNIEGGGNNSKPARNILGGHGEHENVKSYDLLADIEVNGIEYPIKTLLKMGYRIEFNDDYSQYRLIYPGYLYSDEEYETDSDYSSDENND